jgi:hypothetical protein
LYSLTIFGEVRSIVRGAKTFPPISVESLLILIFSAGQESSCAEWAILHCCRFDFACLNITPTKWHLVKYCSTLNYSAVFNGCGFRINTDLECCAPFAGFYVQSRQAVLSSEVSQHAGVLR